MKGWADIMGKKLTIWLWISVALAIGGAILLYPIGGATANVVFGIVKIGMVTGLLMLLIAKKKAGLCVWAAFSVCAVVMTIIKWPTLGGAPLLLAGSIFVDIFMPLGAYLIMKKDGLMK